MPLFGYQLNHISHKMCIIYFIVRMIINMNVSTIYVIIEDFDYSEKT